LRGASTFSLSMIPAQIIDIDSALLGEYAEHKVRKNDTQSERVDIVKAVEAELGERRGRPSKEKYQNFDENRNIPSVTASLAKLPPADQVLLASIDKKKEAQQVVNEIKKRNLAVTYTQISVR
jgi:hypothetical protein